MIQEETLYCDCGCRVKMAVRRGDKIVIKDKQHGRHHFLVLQLDKSQQVALESEK